LARKIVRGFPPSGNRTADDDKEFRRGFDAHLFVQETACFLLPGAAGQFWSIGVVFVAFSADVYNSLNG
jgi:hypothetical protein